MHLRTDTAANANFARVPTISRPRNSFSIAKRHLTTMQFDYLYPMYWKYIYPGDTISVVHKMMARLGTQDAILYDDFYFDVHAWYVPFRLLQTNWSRYQFNDQPGGPSQDNSSLSSPKITLTGLGAGGFTAKSLYDYFGFPTEVDFSGNTEHMNNYLARCYNFIWNTNYRDQNLQDPVTVDLDDGPDDPADYVLLKRGKRHDKFTSCLTAAQKGTAPTLPVGSTAPIEATGRITWVETGGGGSGATIGQKSTTASGLTYDVLTGSHVDNAHNQYSSGLQADLASAIGASVNEMRTSIAIQQLYEGDARGGTRDVEAIQHRWGVTVPDFRLQRPEYLGGQTFTFDGQVVPQTSETGTTPQGTLVQFSQALSGFPVTHSFQEHGVLMILVSARSNITYQEGLRRELSYETRFDWYQPEFANLGEVGVKKKEIYAIGSTGVQDNEYFGYQEYGYELRYEDNMVTGEFRSNYSASRDNKHMADDYSSVPVLGDSWIQSNTAATRNLVVATATADPIEMSTLTQGHIARTLPMFSVPGLPRL